MQEEFQAVVEVAGEEMITLLLPKMLVEEVDKEKYESGHGRR